MRSGFLVFPLAAVLLVAGCSPGGQSPDPTPSVLPVTSPAPTHTPTPSATSSQDALYAEAERVYRAALEAQWKSELTGDYSQFPSEMGDYYSPEYLEAFRRVYEDAARIGLRLTGGAPSVEIAPATGLGKDESVAVLMICYDARELTAENAQGEVLHKGMLLHMLAYFKFYDQQLKMFDLESQEVAECSVR